MRSSLLRAPTRAGIRHRPAQEATAALRRRDVAGLGQLLFQPGDMLLGLIKAHFLKDHRLHQAIDGVGLLDQTLVDQAFGLGVAGARTRMGQTVEHAKDKVFLLGRHLSAFHERDELSDAARFIDNCGVIKARMIFRLYVSMVAIFAAMQHIWCIATKR